MKIGIDARFVGPQGTGLGKYSEKLIENLEVQDKKNHYFVFLRKQNWDYLKFKSNNFQKVLADVPWYSVEEQIRLPKIFKNQKLDLLHIPHFNAPILYKQKFIVTIHDLIHHQFSETSATTKNFLTFKIKRFAYKKVFENAINKSVKIIVPSNFVKNQIIKNYQIDKAKISVTYEAAEEEYFSNKLPDTSYQKHTLLYVGNSYPHKNLTNLLTALTLLKEPIKLILVCPRDIFWERLQKEIKSRNLETIVEIRGFMNAKELSRLFSNASAYVFPTLSEGFGIPGLNAMACGLPVTCSNIPTLREIYKNAALYFDPNDPTDIADKIKNVLENEELKNNLIKKGKAQAKKYSWLKMAHQTLQVYETLKI